jgi:hypothetical protein
MIPVIIIVLFIAFVIFSKKLVDKKIIKDYRILHICDIIFIVAIIESFVRYS